MGLRWRIPTSLHQVCGWTCNNAQKITYNYLIILLWMHSTKMLNWGDPWINFIQCCHILTSHCINHLLVLTCSSTVSHSLWHQDYKQASVQYNDSQIMGHYWEHIISQTAVRVKLRADWVDFTWYPFNRSSNKGQHQQVHLQCIQDYLNIIEPFGRHVLLLLHAHIVLWHLWDLQSGS